MTATQINTAHARKLAEQFQRGFDLGLHRNATLEQMPLSSIGDRVVYLMLSPGRLSAKEGCTITVDFARREVRTNVCNGSTAF